MEIGQVVIKTSYRISFNINVGMNYLAEHDMLVEI